MSQNTCYFIFLNGIMLLNTDEIIETLEIVVNVNRNITIKCMNDYKCLLQ